MGLSGAFNSFLVLASMRTLHGMLNAASNPLSFSLVADYFPADRRATANSLVQAGNYIGGGFSSLSILLITSYGWRNAYGVLCAVGALSAFALWAFVKEPVRGRFMDEKEK